MIEQKVSQSFLDIFEYFFSESTSSEDEYLITQLSKSRSSPKSSPKHRTRANFLASIRNERAKLRKATND